MLYLLTGDIQTGKTTWLKQVVSQAQANNLSVDGFMTPALFEGDRKTGIQLRLLPGEDLLPYAWADDADAHEDAREFNGGLKLHWHIRDDAIAAANEHMARITASTPKPQLLIVDELGFLEFNKGRGIMEAMRVLDQGLYEDAVVVMRPALLEAAQERWFTGAGGPENVRTIDPGYPLL